MKGNRRWSVLLALFLLLSLINSRSFATSSEDEARTMDNRRHQAILAADIAALETLLADDLIFIHSNGTVDNQGQFLAPLKSEDLRVKNTVHEDVRVRVFGDVAIVTGKMTPTAVFKGEERTYTFLYSNVWVRRNDRWQMGHWQSTGLPAKP